MAAPRRFSDEPAALAARAENPILVAALLAGLVLGCGGSPARAAGAPRVDLQATARRRMAQRPAGASQATWDLVVRVDATWSSDARPMASELGGDGSAGLAGAPSVRLADVIDLPGEPTAAEVVALVLARAERRWPSLNDLSDRARRRGWVPDVRVEARRGQGRDQSARQNDGELDRLDQSTDDELTLSGRLSFRLDRVVFAPEEPAIAREARSRDRTLQALRRDVLALYYERRRLQLRIIKERRGSIDDLVRIAEIEDELAGLAGEPLFRRDIRPTPAGAEVAP